MPLELNARVCPSASAGEVTDYERMRSDNIRANAAKLAELTGDGPKSTGELDGQHGVVEKAAKKKRGPPSGDHLEELEKERAQPLPELEETARRLLCLSKHKLSPSREETARQSSLDPASKGMN